MARFRNICDSHKLRGIFLYGSIFSVYYHIYYVLTRVEFSSTEYCVTLVCM